MPADPREAGRKGGRSKSPAKLAACRRNGFQKVQREAAPEEKPAPPLLVADVLAACEEKIDAGQPAEARKIFGQYVEQTLPQEWELPNADA